MRPKKKNVTNAELALMSLLAEKAMHGYEIEQVIEQRGMREWTSIGFSSIYYLLEKMRKLGWLARKLKHSEIGGPAKQIYSLTGIGHSIWEKAIIEALSHPKSINNQFQIALSVIPLLDKVEVSNALATYAAELQMTIEKLRLKLDGYGPHAPWHVSAMFDLSITQLSANLDWVQEFHNNYSLLDK